MQMADEQRAPGLLAADRRPDAAGLGRAREEIMDEKVLV